MFSKDRLVPLSGNWVAMARDGEDEEKWADACPLLLHSSSDLQSPPNSASRLSLVKENIYSFPNF